MWFRQTAAKGSLVLALALLSGGCRTVSDTGPGLACVDTVTALRSLQAPEGRRAVVVAGYHEPGDGGGGCFFWDPACTAQDDRGLTIVPGNTPGRGRWRRLVSDSRYSVKWFGAEGRQTDDTAAIQAAIDALPPRGGTVWFPGGDYRVSETIVIGDGNGKDTYSSRNGIKLVGQGAGFAVHDPARIPTMLCSTAPMAAVIDVRGRISDVRIQDLFVGAELQADVGIRLQAVSGTVLRNLKIMQFRERGLELLGGGPPTGNYNVVNQFDNLFVASTRDHHVGLYMDGDYAVQNDTWLSSFRTCRFDTAAAENAAAAWLKFVDSISFYRCHFATSRVSCTGLVLDALDNHDFPCGLAFYDCSINSVKVREDETHRIRKSYFYGYGTYDHEQVPDHPSLIGITDDGRSFHMPDH
jgi:hypothetical protein